MRVIVAIIIGVLSVGILLPWAIAIGRDHQSQWFPQLRIALAGIVMVMALACSSGPAQDERPTATPTATPEPTAAPEPTPEPTATLVPTATEPTATAVPEPTATATPEPTPEPTPTPKPSATPEPAVVPTVAVVAAPASTVSPATYATLTPTATPEPTPTETVRRLVSATQVESTPAVTWESQPDCDAPGVLAEAKVQYGVRHPSVSLIQDIQELRRNEGQRVCLAAVQQEDGEWYELQLLIVRGTSGFEVRAARGRQLWRGLAVSPEYRCAPYDADDYPYSQSVEERIIAEMGGIIYGPYTGTYFSNRGETDIEHIVARSEAHDSGLCAADAATRRRFSGDLLGLTLASPSVNRHQKIAYDAAEWLPDLNQCWYADRIVRVRQKYGLTIDQREADALDAVIAGCSSFEMVVVSAPAADPSPTPGTGVDALAMWDDNNNGRITCAEARAHGIAPVRKGHPAYEYMDDRDNDGVVCE